MNLYVILYMKTPFSVSFPLPNVNRRHIAIPKFSLDAICTHTHTELAELSRRKDKSAYINSSWGEIKLINLVLCYDIHTNRIE